MWSVVAEWLGCRILNQRVMGSNPGEGCDICEQDTLNQQLGVAIISKNCLRHPYNVSKKKKEKNGLISRDQEIPDQ
jgi:hypothetical protein